MPPHQGERSRTAFFSFSDKPYYPSPVVTIIINEKPRSSVSALPRPLQPSASGWILQGCNNHKHIYTRRHTIEHGKKKFGTDNAAQLKLKRKSLAFFGGGKKLFLGFYRVVCRLYKLLRNQEPT